MKELLKQKTTWAGVSAIISAIAMYCTGDADSATSVQMAMGGLIAIFMRQGIAKAK